MRRVAAFLWLGLALVAGAADTNIPKHGPLGPGPNDRIVARITAQLLEQAHYLQQPFNDDVSSRFLDRYVNTLDPQHLHFLQSDLAEFEIFRTKLDDMTTKRGDTAAAYAIANQFIVRLEQRIAFSQELLKEGQFEFDGDEHILINRKEAPFPKDMEEAQRLWRSRVRFEVLQEKLNQVKPGSTNTVAARSEGDPAAANKTVKEAPKKAEDPIEIITKRYNRVLRMFREWDNEDALEVYLTALAHVYDPHSDYLGKSQLENFSISMNLSLFGIGAVLESVDGYCTIKLLTPGGPAERSGKIKPKDRIVAVAQGDQDPVDVVEMKLNKAVELIRGVKGTEVRLTVIPADAPDPSTRVVISLIREKIKLEDQAAKSKLIELGDAKGKPVRLGVIELPSFYAGFDIVGKGDNDGSKSSTSEDVAKLVKKLKDEGVQGVILDLRRNGGGSLEEAIKLTGLFIKQGPVVQVRDPGPEVHVQVDEDRDELIAYDGPLIVLTSHFSASASEILAGALQDYGRAVIVGDASTHGKGTVQALNQLKQVLGNRGIHLTNDPGALKLTIRKFYRANGASTQLKGVVPDIILPSVMDAAEIGEASLDDPLPWDTIKPADDFKPMNVVQPFLPTLKERATERIKTGKDFAYIREDYEIAKTVRDDKTISLNLAERLKEKQDAEVRKKARDAERLARVETKETVYEIALKNADQPGLPEPLGKTNTIAVAKGTLPGAAASANSASVAAGPKPAGDAANVDGEDDEEKVPKVDVPLEEAKRILLDYISLAAGKGGAVAKNP